MKNRKEFDRLVACLSHLYFFSADEPIYSPDGFHEITFSLQRFPIYLFGKVMFDDLGSITLILEEKNLLEEKKVLTCYKIDDVTELLSELNNELNKFFQVVSNISTIFE